MGLAARTVKTAFDLGWRNDVRKHRNYIFGPTLSVNAMLSLGVLGSIEWMTLDPCMRRGSAVLSILN